MKLKILLPLVLMLCAAARVPVVNDDSPLPSGIPPYLYVQSAWVDSTLQALTPDERIGQLFMVAAYSKDNSDQYKVSQLIQKYHIGGLIMMQGGPGRQVAEVNYYQSISKVQLLIGQDAEWGPGMRLDSTIIFPRQLMLGAIQDTNLIYEFGKEMARELLRIGVNVSFSPVVDINSNPNNPVIGDRSFGEDKYNVAIHGIAYMRGLQDGGVMACAKHFPGHGDTDEDSHKTLPTVSASRAQLDSMELYPFQKMIEAGVGSVMIAHLFVPALDTTAGQASTLSRKIVTGVLKNDLGFKGLAITDALNMGGVSNYTAAGMIDTKALLAGNDILLFSQDVGLAIQQIKAAITRKEISQEDIDMRVRKILQAKYWLGLNVRKTISTDSLFHDLNNSKVQFLKQRLIESALTLLRNGNNFLPIKNLDSLSFASVSIGVSEKTPFQWMLANYALFTDFQMDKDASSTEFTALLAKLKKYDAVFVSLHGMSRSAASGFGVTLNSKDFIRKLEQQNKTIITVFGNPYALKYFDDADWLLEAYNDDEVTQKMAAQIFFGGVKANGKLPVSASDHIKAGDGVITSSSLRLKYSMPEDAGINSDQLADIDNIVHEGMDEHAYPGCQVWIAKDGKVIWQKSYGHFTYDIDKDVEDNDLYDLASVTKIAATTLMLMKLYEEKKLDLNARVSDYLPEWSDYDKGTLRIHSLLTHSAGFKAWIPFYKETFDSTGHLSSAIYSYLNHAPYTVAITPKLFMNQSFQDTIWKRILETPLETPGKYVYSDLDFYVLKKIAERISGESLDVYVRDNFYTSLGLSTMTYNPLFFFPTEQIVPSNYDYTWRNDKIQGTVHDQGAAMMGGVAGHAGLFSNANDLGVLMEMLDQKGSYAGKNYFDAATIEKFTERYSTDSRRGLGFDKPEVNGNSPTCDSASPSVFGHQGFTGTCVWVDPDSHLVYVFLSNRTFPDDENKKINSLGIRNRIMQVVYDAMKHSD